MTENKRFIQKDEAIINTMTDELVTAGSEDSAEIIVDWLNSQDDYIDYLEKQNKRLKERIEELASNDKIVFLNEYGDVDD